MGLPEFDTRGVDAIFGSVTYTEYPMALTTGPRDLSRTDLVVDKTSILSLFSEPLMWFLENPQ
jgi:hypothetical protein